MLAFIKYFAIIICSFYIYGKLLNISRPQNHYIYLILGVPCLSLGTVLFDSIFPQATDLTLILISFFFLLRIVKTTPEAAITTTIISYGISYFIFSLSTVVSAD